MAKCPHLLLACLAILGGCASDDDAAIIPGAGSDAAVASPDAGAVSDAAPRPADAAPPDAPPIIVRDRSVKLATAATGFAIAGDSLYVRRSFDFEEAPLPGIYRCPLAGCPASPQKLHALAEPHLQQGSDVAVLGSKLLWIDDNVLYQSDLDGANVEKRYEACGDSCFLFGVKTAGDVAYVAEHTFTTAVVRASKAPGFAAVVAGTDGTYVGPGATQGIHGVTFAVDGQSLAFCQETFPVEYGTTTMNPIQVVKLASGAPKAIGAATHVDAPDANMVIAGGFLVFHTPGNRGLGDVQACPLGGCSGAPRVLSSWSSVENGPLAVSGTTVYFQEHHYFLDSGEHVFRIAAVDLAAPGAAPIYYGDDDTWFRHGQIWQLAVASGKLYAIGTQLDHFGTNDYELRALPLTGHP